MIYNLKTGNFSNFEKFRDNVLVPRTYFIAFDSISALYNTDIRNERYNSPLVECLSGDWDFVYYSDNTAVEDNFDTDKIKFDTVKVPSTWQHTGYEEPYYVNTRYQFTPNPPDIPLDCPVGIYRKFIDINDDTLGYTLSFLGVAGSLELFINGEYVGYSEGSHNTAEFEINKFLHIGKNEIVVQNHKWANGTYLECQDMFRCNGIFRDVLLYISKRNSVYDFDIKTPYSNGKYDLEFIPSLKLSDKCELSIQLFDGENLVKSKSVNVSPEYIDEIIFENLDVVEWSAEKPYLYELIITLAQDGEVQEVIRKSIGFKHIEIKGNVFYFNEKPIKLLGVNHHDTNPKTGYVMTVEDMEKDISLIKQYNANCVRTSHYPPDATFLDLCDEYGVYVVDEADIETHGCEREMKKPGACSHNPKWREHYWDRIYRMYSRDKCHASITMWSLGNEAHGYNNQDYCYENLKQITNIPIHYEGVCRTKRWAYDVLSQMYTFPNVCEKIAKGSGLPKKYYKKPFYLCEYAHAMGVGAGELERYVKCFYSADNMLGGCIWEFVDHAIYHENGKYEYTYGGDHAEEKHDGNFCVDGLFFPDRTPHSGALQMKACYRPVRASRISNGKYSFFNHRYFENANINVKYSYFTDGVQTDSGTVDLTIEAQQSQTVELNEPKFDTNRHNSIIIEYYENDFLVASEQIIITSGVLKSTVESNGKISLKKSENKLFIAFDNGSMIIDRGTGFIQSYKYKDTEFINQFPISDFKGFSVQLYRAPIDNDMYISKYWHKIRLDEIATNCKVTDFTDKGSYVEVNAEMKSVLPMKFLRLKTAINYKIYASGEVAVKFTCTNSGFIKLVARYGVQLEMAEGFDKLKYFALGDRVNLPDFKEHAQNKIYECSVSQLREDYIKPQESAVRCDARFLEIKNSDSIGLRFEAMGKPFAFAVNNFTPSQCSRALHREDIKNMPSVCVNIDESIMGAGSNSCGPPASKQYRVGRLKGKCLQFSFKAIGD